MKEIGGFFELELNKGKEFHPEAIKLNTGRNCLEHILRIRKYKKIYIPYYTCEVILEPINKLGLSYEFYHIDEKLEPIFNKEVFSNEGFLYTNYFGLKEKQVEELSIKYKTLIIDNCQAFFSKPLKNIDTFYSPRKFFGVPDGGYLYMNADDGSIFQKDKSNERISHLIGRIETKAEQYYPIYIENEKSLANQPILQMSNLTNSLLKGIDYETVAEKRSENFTYLHSKLQNTNLLKIGESINYTPMVYPYLLKNGLEIKRKLIKEKIYVASYWSNVKEWLKDEDCFETSLQDNLIPIPIDQRYTINNMEYIIKKLLND